MIFILVHPLVAVLGCDEFVFAEASVDKGIDESGREVLARRVHGVVRQK